MDEIFRNLKQKVSVNTIVELMKEAQLISDDKDEDVREILQKQDSSKIANIDELSEKLGIAKKSNSTIKGVISGSKTGMTSTKHSLNVLQKQQEQSNLTEEEEEMARHEKNIALY